MRVFSSFLLILYTFSWIITFIVYQSLSRKGVGLKRWFPVRLTSLVLPICQFIGLWSNCFFALQNTHTFTNAMTQSTFFDKGLTFVMNVTSWRSFTRLEIHSNVHHDNFKHEKHGNLQLFDLFSSCVLSLWNNNKNDPITIWIH